MKGITGWYGIEQESDQARQLAQNLASLSPTGHSESLSSVAGNYYAMASCTWNTENTIYENQRLLLAYSGTPQIKTDSDPGEAIACAYVHQGVECLKEIHGRFSLAIIDKEQHRVLLAIDRLGIEQLSYSYQDQQLLFGTRTDTIANHPHFDKLISPQGIFNYLYFHMVPSPGSIYSGIEKLGPGQYLLLENGSLKRDYYWQLSYRDNDDVEFGKLNDDLHNHLLSSVKRANSGNSTGAFLSGGLDSSTMSWALSEISSRPAKTFSIGFDAEGYDETPYARVVAQRFNTDHHEYYVTPEDVLEAIPRIAAIYDEPFGNASAIPTYFCARMAREAGITDLIAGDGGDEIFAGNERYAKQAIFEVYGKIPSGLRSHVLEPLISVFPGKSKILPVRKLESYINQARIPLPERMQTYNFLYRSPLADIFSPELLGQVDSAWPSTMEREAYQRARTESVLNRLLHLDLKVTLADNDLRKVNTMCELAGVNVHYPLLDEQMVDFSARIPVSIKMKPNDLRYFFRKAMRHQLPEETLSKHKHGFGLPFGVWLKEYRPLKELAGDSLSQLSKRGLINANYIDKLWMQHQNEHSSYYGVMIWVMMMLEQWFQTHQVLSD